jgi:hypothetical protein
MTKLTHKDLWEQSFTIPEGEHRKLSFGLLNVYISRMHGDWQFRNHYSVGDESQREKAPDFMRLKNPPAEEGTLTRIIQSTGNDKLEKNESAEAIDKTIIRFVPRLADRSIVAKPIAPFLLPPHEKITVYLSSPVWLAIKIGEQTESLLEIPSFKLSDTWFGPRPHIGELCYASRFSGRTNLELLPKRMSRIITPVQIVNNGSDKLKIEKIAIPSAYLAVYLTDAGELWTSELKVVRESDKATPQVNIEKNLPDYVKDARLISQPRENYVSGILGKTIDRLLS